MLAAMNRTLSPSRNARYSYMRRLPEKHVSRVAIFWATRSSHSGADKDGGGCSAIHTTTSSKIIDELPVARKYGPSGIRVDLLLHIVWQIVVCHGRLCTKNSNG